MLSCITRSRGCVCTQGARDCSSVLYYALFFFLLLLSLLHFVVAATAKMGRGNTSSCGQKWIVIDGLQISNRGTS